MASEAVFIPPIMEFDSPPFRLVDVKTLSSSEFRDVMIKFNELLAPVLRSGMRQPDSEDVTDSELICATTPLTTPVHPPGSTAAEQIEANLNRPPPPFNSGENHPLFGNVLFGAYQIGTGELVGAFSINNIQILEQTVDKLTIHGMSAAGYPHESEQQLATFWGQTKRRILEADLPMENGQVLDLIEWTFPIEGRYTWKSFTAGDGVADMMINDLARNPNPAANHDLTETDFQGRQVPLKLRRRGA